MIDILDMYSQDGCLPLPRISIYDVSYRYHNKYRLGAAATFFTQLTLHWRALVLLLNWLSL